MGSSKNGQLDSFPSGLLHINLFNARDIKPGEFSRAGRADPYCIISYDGRESPKSRVMQDASSNPQWNQHFVFPIRRDVTTEKANKEHRGFRKLFSSKSDKEGREGSVIGSDQDVLEVKILDRNVVRQDFDMGKVRITNLARLVTSSPNWTLVRQPYPVLAEEKGGEGTYRGELFLSISFERVDERQFGMGWYTEITVDDNIQFSTSGQEGENSSDRGMDLQSQTQNDRQQLLDDLAKAQEMERECKATSDALRSQLKAAEEENQQFQIKLQGAMVHKGNLDSHNSELMKKVEGLELQNSELKATLGVQESIVSDLRKQLQDAVSKAQQSEEDVQKEREFSAGATNGNLAIENQLLEARHLIEELTGLKANAEKSVVEWEKKAASLEVEKAKLEEKAAGLEGEKANLGEINSNLDQELVAASDLSKKSGEEKVKLQAENDSLQSKLSVTEDNHLQLRNEFATLQAENTHLDEVISKLEQDLASESESAQKLDQERTLLTKKLESVESRLSILQEENILLKDQIDSLEHRNQLLDEEWAYAEKSLAGANERVEKQKNEILELTEKLEALQTKFTYLEGENSHLEERVASLQADRKKLEEEYSTLERSLASATEESAKRDKEKSELHSKLEVHGGRVSTLEVDNVQLKEKVDRLQGERDELEEYGAKFSQALASANDHTVELEAANSKLTEEAKGIQNTISSLQRQRDQLKEKVVDLQTERNNLEKELTQSISSSSQHLNKMLQENSELLAKIGDLGSVLAGLEAEKTRLEDRVASLQNEKKHLKEEDAKLGQALLLESEHSWKLDQQKSDLSKQVDSLGDQISTLKTGNTGLNWQKLAKVSQLEGKVGILEGELRTAQTTAAELTRKLQKETETSDSLQREVSDLQSNQVSLENDLVQTRSSIAELQSSLKRAQIQAADLLTENKKLDEAKSSTAKELILARTRLVASQISLKRSKNKVADLTTENAKLREAQSSVETELSSAKSQILGLHGSAKNRQTEVADLTTKHTRLTEAKTAIETELGTARSRVLELQKSLTTAQNQVAELVSEKTKLTDIKSSTEKKLERVTSTSNATIRRLEEQLIACRDTQKALEETLNNAKPAPVQIPSRGIRGSSSVDPNQVQTSDSWLDRLCCGLFHRERYPHTEPLLAEQRRPQRSAI